MPADTLGKSELPAPCWYSGLLYLKQLATSIFIETLPSTYLLVGYLGKLMAKKLIMFFCKILAHSLLVCEVLFSASGKVYCQ